MSEYFEYKLLNIFSMDYEEWKKALSKIGLDGWEIVQIEWDYSPRLSFWTRLKYWVNFRRRYYTWRALRETAKSYYEANGHWPTPQLDRVLMKRRRQG